MATTLKPNPVKIEKDSLVLNMVIAAAIFPEVFNYFKKLNNINLQEEIIRLINLGILASKNISDVSNVAYVQKEFQTLYYNFEKVIRQLYEQLNDQFGIDGSLVTDVFDPNKDGTPLNILKTDFEKKFIELSEKFAVTTGVTKLKEKTPLKGFVFEDHCVPILEEFAKVFGDTVDFTGKVKGIITNCLKGDLVITIAGTSQKIGFEFKDRGPMSLHYLLNEGKTCLENRQAEFCVVIVKNAESLPKSVGMINEYDNILICALGFDGDEALHDEILRLAYQWGRLRIQSQSSENKKLDPLFVQEKIKSIQQKLEELKQIKTQCSNIEKSSTKILSITNSTKEQVLEDLNEILGSMGEENDI